MTKKNRCTVRKSQRLLITDLDGTMAHFVTAYLSPAITHASASIASVFGLSVHSIVQILARAMQKYDHEYPWLLEVSELRTLFRGTDKQFVKRVVAPFWNAWDKAIVELCRPCPGVKSTLNKLGKRDIPVVCLTNAHDFCAVLRLVASGLAPSLSTVIGIEAVAPDGIDTTFQTERRRRILANCPIPVISLPPTQKKPSPAGIFRALEVHGVPPQHAVLTGDSRALDGGAAQNAGVPFVLMEHELFTTAHFDWLFGGGKKPSRKATKSNIPVLLTASHYGELLGVFDGR